jgi:hypothetical protein
MPVFDTNTLILFKIPGSDTRYSDTSDALQKHKKRHFHEEKRKPPRDFLFDWIFLLNAEDRHNILQIRETNFTSWAPQFEKS